MSRSILDILTGRRPAEPQAKPISNAGGSASLPTIVRGHRIKIAAIKSATRHIFHFDCAGHRLTADIQMKQE